MNAEVIEQLSPLTSDLRAQNPDRYQATLFAPPACREPLIALYAFDHEIARAQWSVREPMAGLIRLQWWQDVIEGFSSSAAVAHPVVQALQRAVIEGGLDRVHLLRAIEGRRRRLEDDEPPAQKAFERYLLDVGGAISCAAAELLGADEPEMLAVADRVGLVGAALQQLCSLPISTSEPKPWLPPAWMDEQGGQAGGKPHAAALRRLADWASAELAAARRQQPSIPRSILPAFFPGTLAGIRMRDPIHQNHPPPLPMAVPRLIWCWLRGRF